MFLALLRTHFSWSVPRAKNILCDIISIVIESFHLACDTIMEKFTLQQLVSFFQHDEQSWNNT